MSVSGFLKREVREVLLTTLFFFAAFVFILGLFKLMLESYDIHFVALGKAAFAALVLAKVVLVLRNRGFVKAFRDRPGIVRVLYLVGVFLVLVLERVLDGWGDAGGFVAALKRVVATGTLELVLAKSLLVAVPLFMFNGWEELERAVGRDRILAAFFRKP